MDWMDGSLGLVEYRAPYGANKQCGKTAEKYYKKIPIQCLTFKQVLYNHKL